MGFKASENASEAAGIDVKLLDMMVRCYRWHDTARSQYGIESLVHEN